MRALRIGTRRSPLARRQTDIVREGLQARGIASVVVPLDTRGDLSPETPLPAFGAPAVFSKEIDEALLRGTIDAAVHSLKDLPTTLPDGISIAAVCRREEAGDALVSRGGLRLRELPRGAVVATSSLRRRAQLLRFRPDLRTADIRGNVGTRVRKLDETDSWEAVLLATAGLLRLGLADRISERLPLSDFLPAAGQGALAVTLRADDLGGIASVRDAVEHEPTRLSTTAERAFLNVLGAGCHAPEAAFASLSATGHARTLRLDGRLLSLDGTRGIDSWGSVENPDPQAARALGEEVAHDVIRRGGTDLLGRSTPPHASGES